MKRICFLLCAFSILLFCCKSGPFNIIKPVSPHQAYERKLISAGLNQTYMGTSWINKSQESLKSPISINLPYQEKGYFAADKVEIAVFRFALQKGQQLIIELTTKPADRFKVYADLLLLSDNNSTRFVAAADTLQQVFKVDIDQTGSYLLRLQPELLSGGEFNLTLTTGPSLKFPLKAGKANQIQSLFGVGRDENTRRHEGIDIFAPFRTPVIAVSAGRVTQVNQNNLGGNVVWFRPEGKDFTLYYAHLDEQTVTAGQLVSYGDTLGRMGNTGNAKTTAPHLHFGIYTNNGAVDPFPFVNPTIKEAPKISSATEFLNASMRTIAVATLQNTLQDRLASGTVLRVLAATGNNYRVELPDGRSGYLPAGRLTATSKPLKRIKINSSQINLYDYPDTAAATKTRFKSGNTVALLGEFKDFQLVESDENLVGWIRK